MTGGKFRRQCWSRRGATRSRDARACHGDAVAMALGRRLVGGTLRIIHAGAIDEPALKTTWRLAQAPSRLPPLRRVTIPSGCSPCS